MENGNSKTENNQWQVAWLLLVSGLAAFCFKLSGIWLQGEFWDIPTNYLVMADQLLHSEVVESFCLPTMVTSVGGLAIAWVILASKLAEKFSNKRKDLAFMVFALVYVVAVFVPAKIAGDKMWNKAQKVLQKHSAPRSVEAHPPIKSSSQTFLLRAFAPLR